MRVGVSEQDPGHMIDGAKAALWMDWLEDNGATKLYERGRVVAYNLRPGLSQYWFLDEAGADNETAR